MQRLNHKKVGSEATRAVGKRHHTYFRKVTPFLGVQTQQVPSFNLNPIRLKYSCRVINGIYVVELPGGELFEKRFLKPSLSIARLPHSVVIVAKSMDRNDTVIIMSVP